MFMALNRNMTGFCVLILYPVAFINSLTSYRNFFVDSLGFSVKTIIALVNRGSFISSFPIFMLFISFSCLIVLVRISSSMVNESGKSRHPCLVPNLRGKVFSLIRKVLWVVSLAGSKGCKLHVF